MGLLSLNLLDVYQQVWLFAVLGIASIFFPRKYLWPKLLQTLFGGFGLLVAGVAGVLLALQLSRYGRVDFVFLLFLGIVFSTLGLIILKWNLFDS